MEVRSTVLVLRTAPIGLWECHAREGEENAICKGTYRPERDDSASRFLVIPHHLPGVSDEDTQHTMQTYPFNIGVVVQLWE